MAPEYKVRYIVTMENSEYEVPEMDLPGMWSQSDFMGGDPDERSYAERGWTENTQHTVENDAPYDPCHGDPNAGWYGAHGVWEPCSVCNPTSVTPPGVGA